MTFLLPFRHVFIIGLLIIFCTTNAEQPYRDPINQGLFYLALVGAGIATLGAAHTGANILITSGHKKPVPFDYKKSFLVPLGAKLVAAAAVGGIYYNGGKLLFSSK
jgi:hypothetical protein